MVKGFDWVYLQGKVKFFKVDAPDPKYRYWGGPLYLTPASIDIFNTLKKGKEGITGIKNELTEDEEGSWINAKRPCVKIWQGKETQLQPVEVVDKDGKPMKGVAIGNGSDVTCKFEYYPFTNPFKKTERGSAIRLYSVRVDNLVPYERKDYNPEQLKAVEGLEKQPQYF